MNRRRWPGPSPQTSPHAAARPPALNDAVLAQVVPPSAVSFATGGLATVHSVPGAFVFDAHEPDPQRRFRRSAGGPFPPGVSAPEPAPGARAAWAGAPGGRPEAVTPSALATPAVYVAAAPAADGDGAASGVAGRAVPKTCACAAVVGEFGAAPVERGYWFRGPSSVQQTRERLHRLCAR